MVALMSRPVRRKRRSAAMQITNTYVEHEGRRYRVCHTGYGRVLMVFLKCAAGGERQLKLQGRRGRQIVKKSGVKLAPDVEVRP